MSADFWMSAANISQVVACVAVVVAILFAIVQIREVTRARYLEALARIFEEFRSEVFFKDRRFVYSHERFSWGSCTDEERTKIERLINTYNRMSFLVKKGMIPQKLILELWSGALLASWQKLKSYVKDRRVATGFSDWAIQFEHLAGLSEEYRTKVLGEKGTGYKVKYPQEDTSGKPQISNGKEESPS